jgi:hypothetical protein
MDVFDLRDRLVADYASYTRSFIKIADPRISARVESDLNAGAFWNEPLLQLNPTFLPGGTIDDLVGEKTIHPECSKIFKIDKTDTDHTGKQLLLHTHERMHESLRAKGRVTIQPVLPVDILGAYVLLPIPGMGGAA